VINPIVLVLAN